MHISISSYCFTLLKTDGAAGYCSGGKVGLTIGILGPNVRKDLEKPVIRSMRKKNKLVYSVSSMEQKNVVWT